MMWYVNVLNNIYFLLFYREILNQQFVQVLIEKFEYYGAPYGEENGDISEVSALPDAIINEICLPLSDSNENVLLYKQDHAHYDDEGTWE